MSLKLAKLFIDFTSDIVSNNSSSIEYDDLKKILMNKDNKQKFDDFLKNNKIKQKKEKKSLSDEPKKPKSSYIIFCSAERDGIVDANPDVEHKDITSLLGLRWKDIQVNNTDLYQKYVDMAAKEKAEYEIKIREYRTLHNIPENIQEVKKPKVVNSKKHMSSFYFFLKDREADVKSANPHLKNNEIRDKIKDEWKELKDDKDNIVKKYKKIATDKKNELLHVSDADDESNSNSPVVITKNKKKNKIRKIVKDDDNDDIEIYSQI